MTIQFTKPGIPVRLTLFITFMLGVCAFGEFGDPRGFLSEDDVNETIIQPGVTWYEVTGTEADTPQVMQVVTVDISEPHLTIKALLGERLSNPDSGQFFRRSTVTQLLEDNDSLVAINSSFFEIRDTMSPRGLQIQDYRILQTPRWDRPALVYTDDGIPGIHNFTLSGSVVYGEDSRDILGFNDFALSNPDISIYSDPWDASPGTDAPFTSEAFIAEVIVQETGFHPSSDPSSPARLQGQITDVRQTEPSVPLQPGTFSISGVGISPAFLLPMEVGEDVEVQWSLEANEDNETIDWNRISQATAGGNLLVVDGTQQSKNTSHWNARHPRSAIGLNADASKLVLLLVEGRQPGRAAGMSLHKIGELMLHMEAENALEFDGGGSSSIAAKVDGNTRLLNTPSDGSQRYVPAGLGIQLVEEALYPVFQDIDLRQRENKWELVFAPFIANRQYELQTSDSLEADSWQDVTMEEPPPRLPTGEGVITLPENQEVTSSTFFRLVFNEEE